jgi:hypothetical protein
MPLLSELIAPETATNFLPENQIYRRLLER